MNTQRRLSNYLVRYVYSEADPSWNWSFKKFCRRRCSCHWPCLSTLVMCFVVSALRAQARLGAKVLIIITWRFKASATWLRIHPAYDCKNTESEPILEARILRVTTRCRWWWSCVEFFLQSYWAASNNYRATHFRPNYREMYKKSKPGDSRSRIMRIIYSGLPSRLSWCRVSSLFSKSYNGLSSTFLRKTYRLIQ